MVRRVSRPLEILGLPGYETLCHQEKEFCSTVRQVHQLAAIVCWILKGYGTIL